MWPSASRAHWTEDLSSERYIRTLRSLKHGAGRASAGDLGGGPNSGLGMLNHPQLTQHGKPGNTEIAHGCDLTGS